MDCPSDDFSLSLNPSQPISTSTSNDPVLTEIYEFLRNFSDMTPDTAPIFNPTEPVNRTTSDVLNNAFGDDYQQSRTVNPVYTISTSNSSQISSQEQFKQQPIVQCVSPTLGKIQIKYHPRSKFRPRTEKESKESSHYIRCEDDIDSAYPCIFIPRSWENQKNIIEVTLVGNDKQPHPYTIDNKERKTSSLIFKQTDPNSLYFHVMEEDYENEEKTFLIQYVKSKQDDNITKELIKTRQLEQSMLRFTRFYQLADGTYQRDESSTEYSCVMTEDYGDFTIEDVFPLYGPMCGNQKVCVELKGHLPKDLKTDLIINITDNGMHWFYQVENIKKNRYNLTFTMPPFPYPLLDRAKVHILIEYKQDIIHQSSYIYTRKLDEELVEDDVNESVTTASNELAGAFPMWSSTGMGCDDRGTKRPRQ